VSRALKLQRTLRDPFYRRFICHRVFAAVEHERVIPNRPYRLILDVGANRGQFYLVARKLHPSTPIWCFEPIPAALRSLRTVTSSDTRVTVWPYALSDASGRLQMTVAEKNDSSSLFAPTRKQTSAFAGTQAVASLPVEVRTLDGVLSSETNLSPFLLKIDVQGAELAVLRGARQLLQHVGDIIVEASLTELYEGQALADEVIAYLFTSGYRLIGIHSLSYDPAGVPIQADFLLSNVNVSAPAS
jgi:FkbM family methyltransferase